ncbi:MAG: hypothetical protein HY614_00175, partial [Candidatus Rokubacteria bacterium]|nr:hypothetical protein [Candidatus Rokubacteria bacterium]
MAHAAAARRAVFAGFVVLFAAVMVAEYFFFRRALAALGDLGLAGAALTLYLLESVLVIVFALALLSFVASGLWVYYRAGDTRFLLAAPLPAGGLFTLRVLETFGLTSWALAVVGLPALLALGTAYGHGGAFYVEGIAVLGLFAILTGSAGALLTAIAGAALRRTRSRLALALLVGTVLLALIGLVGRNVVPSAGDFYAIFEPGMLNGKPASIKFIETRFALWPSHPFAAALYTAATGDRAGSAATRTTLYLAPLALLLAVATVGRALYARTLPAVAE